MSNIFKQGMTVKLTQALFISTYSTVALPKGTKGVVYAVDLDGQIAIAFAQFDAYGVPAIVQMSCGDFAEYVTEIAVSKDDAFGDFEIQVVRTKDGNFNEYQTLLYVRDHLLTCSSKQSHHPSQLPIALNDPQMVQPIAQTLKSLRQKGFRDEAVSNMLTDLLFTYLLYGFQKTLSFADFFQSATHAVFARHHTA